MLDDVGEHDDVEAVGVGEVLERELADVEVERGAGVLGRRAAELEAERLVAAPTRLVEQQAGAAADVEQAPARHERGDQVEEPAGRRAAAFLLAEVGLVRHVAVQVV